MIFDYSLGNGMLMVGVFGPKHPCEEVFIKHVGNNQYNVQYVNTNLLDDLHPWKKSFFFH